MGGLLFKSEMLPFFYSYLRMSKILGPALPRTTGFPVIIADESVVL